MYVGGHDPPSRQTESLFAFVRAVVFLFFFERTVGVSSLQTSAQQGQNTLFRARASQHTPIRKL